MVHLPCFFVAALFCASLPAVAGQAVATTSAPSVADVDQVYLMRTVRRAVVKTMEGGQYEPAYVPEALAGLSCRVSVRLRSGGKLMGSADSAELPVVQGCLEAVSVAVAAAKRRGPAGADPAGLSLEVELVGPRQPVGTGNEDPAQLAQRFRPGIDGIAMRVADKEVLVRPSQLISMEIFCRNDEELGHRCDRYQVAIENLQSKLGLRREPPEFDPRSVTVLKFATTHLYEPKPDAAPVELFSGLRWVRPGEVNRDSMLAAADEFARYLRYRQLEDGFFSYEFLPGRDMYWDEQNWVRQASTAWAMAVHARARGDAASAAAAERAIASLDKMVKPLKDSPGASFVATPEGDYPLGATAMYCLALLDGPDPHRYADRVAELLNGLAAMQSPNGSFRTHFPPSGGDWSQNYFPGEALLAIARQYAVTHDGRWRDVCDRALPYYTRYFRENRPPAFAPWQMQAWGQLARVTLLRRYADFVYEMADVLLSSQLRESGPPLAIYDGAFDTLKTGRPGIATAAYVQGLVEAVRTAEALGDRERAARYAEAVRRASRFVVQLQFRPEECFYVQSPRDVVGGARSLPSDPTLRIDYSEQSLAALLGAWEIGAATSQPAAATSSAPAR
jgi:hypothetical protein